jgi:Co/Zn/Cd efflux system component
MPPIFKALASITVWVLFINGCLGIVLSAVSRLVGENPIGALCAWVIGIASLILAVCAMKLRKMLE